MTRPRGTRKYFHQRLTPAEKKKILAEIRKGTKQIEVAREFGCNVITIRRIQKAAGLKLWCELTPEIERECVALLRLGHGQYRVSRMTRVPEPKIRKLMAKYRIHHAVGDHPGLPAAKRSRILQSVLKRENFAAHIAKKERVSHDPILRIAHAIYGPGRFCSRGKPLTSVANVDANVESNYQKFLEGVFRKRFSMEAQVEELTGIFTQFTESFIKIWYDGVIPSDRNAFIAALLESYMPSVKPSFVGMFTDQEWAKERALVAGYLRTAVDTLHAQTGLVH